MSCSNYARAPSAAPKAMEAAVEQLLHASTLRIAEPASEDAEDLTVSFSAAGAKPDIPWTLPSLTLVCADWDMLDLVRLYCVDDELVRIQTSGA